MATYLPSVQLIGAQKAGTSAIADWLFEGKFRRPRVFDNEPWYYGIEIHFFDSNCRFDQGLEFYAKRFQYGDDSTENTLTMDATPDTLPFAERVRSIYDEVGEANNLKIIVILREPDFRELSLYNHLVFESRRLDASERTVWHKQVIKPNDSTMSFDEFVRDVSVPALHREIGPGRSTRHGLYATHLRQWFELFDRKQILVLSYDELQQDPQKLQERIQRFLGFVIFGALRRSNSNDHPSKVKAPSEVAQAALQQVFQTDSENLYQRLEAHPGPPMEQRPFPRFQGTPTCSESDQ